jgi:hypothetical protein
MKLCLFVCVATLLFSLPMRSQPSNMKQWLNTGTEKQRVHKLASLGVADEMARSAVFERDIEWMRIRTESQNETAIMFFPCGAMYGASLYVLRNSYKGWHVTNRVGFDCHYDQSVSVEAKSVRKPNVDDILVHHECEEHGTGFVQQDFNVFAVSSGKLRLLLDAQEVVSEDDLPIGGERLQRSSFVTFQEQTGVPAIQETRCTTQDGQLTIEKRTFHWSDSPGRFLASKLVRVKAVADKAKAVCR